MPDTKLRALGKSHSREGFDIHPQLYDIWLESLLLTIRQHDPELEQLDQLAWAEVLGKGIDIIKSYY